MSADRHGDVAPGLTLGLVVIAVAWGGGLLAVTGLNLATGGSNAHARAMGDLYAFASLAMWAAASAGATVGAVGGFELARARRSSAAFLAAGFLAVLAAWNATELVAAWSQPYLYQPGWRSDVLAAGSWVRPGAVLAVTAALCVAGWADRGVRVLAGSALGAAALAMPPPPLVGAVRDWIEQRHAPLWPIHRPPAEWRLWATPAVMAIGAFGWAAITVVIVLRQPRGAPRTLELEPAAVRAIRLGIAVIAIAVVAIAAGVAVALRDQLSPAATRAMSLAAPIAVVVACLTLAIAALGLAWVEVGVSARRRLHLAAVLALWFALVLVGQILWNHRGPLEDLMRDWNLQPDIPPAAAAVIAIVALLAVWWALADLTRRAGLATRPGHGLVVALAFALGAATAPWVLDGRRGAPLDPLRIATLATSALVNLGAFAALAWAAFQAAAALRAPR